MPNKYLPASNINLPDINHRGNGSRDDLIAIGSPPFSWRHPSVRATVSLADNPADVPSLGRDLSRLARVLVAALFNYPTQGRFHIRLLSVPTMPERIRRATTLIIIFFDGCASPSSLSPRLKMHINISEALKSGDYLTWKGAHRSCRWPFVSSLIPAARISLVRHKNNKVRMAANRETFIITI